MGQTQRSSTAEGQAAETLDPWLLLLLLSTQHLLILQLLLLNWQHLLLLALLLLLLLHSECGWLLTAAALR
jgi:hypothetical protein